jgi:hypothetical protein
MTRMMEHSQNSVRVTPPAAEGNEKQSHPKRAMIDTLRNTGLYGPNQMLYAYANAAVPNDAADPYVTGKDIPC